MLKKWVNKAFTHFQYILPHHALSKGMGFFAESHFTPLKNWLIRQFLRHYPVNMQEAEIEDPFAYASFNDFFIRPIKRALRPVDASHAHVTSPVDGILAQSGCITQGRLLQAKDYYFDLYHLLGKQEGLAETFTEGCFATFYLAPHHYHRVHMPLHGTLKQTIYVPGRLFSVNEATTAGIPGLYSKNERLISIFDTPVSQMALIMVGAMIVGSMQMNWMQQPIRTPKPHIDHFHSSPVVLKKGEELGYFKMGSTVILLFEKDRVQWLPILHTGASLKLGEAIGKVKTQTGLPP